MVCTISTTTTLYLVLQPTHTSASGNRSPIRDQHTTEMPGLIEDSYTLKEVPCDTHDGNGREPVLEPESDGQDSQTQPLCRSCDQLLKIAKEAVSTTSKLTDMPPPSAIPSKSRISRAADAVSRAVVEPMKSAARSHNAFRKNSFNTASQRSTVQYLCSQPTSNTSDIGKAMSEKSVNSVYQNPQAAQSDVSMRSACSGLRDSRLPTLGPSSFLKGHLIWAPHHVTAMNTRQQAAENTQSVQSSAAKICSQRRLMVVLWSYPATLFCLPCYTNDGNGFNPRVAYANENNIYLEDLRKRPAPETSCYPALACHRHDIGTGMPVSIALTECLPVQIMEDIERVGRLRTAEAGRLISIWSSLAAKAQETMGYY